MADEKRSPEAWEVTNKDEFLACLQGLIEAGESDDPYSNARRHRYLRVLANAIHSKQPLPTSDYRECG